MVKSHLKHYDFTLDYEIFHKTELYHQLLKWVPFVTMNI